MPAAVASALARQLEGDLAWARKSETAKKFSSPVAKGIARGLEESAAWARGELKLRARVIQVPDSVDVRALRAKLGLSQQKFAERYYFNPRTVQDWEQGRHEPDGATRAYLTVIARDPGAVEKALRG